MAVAKKQVSAGGSRRAQEIVRTAKRRRRPNIVGARRLVQVVLSEEEYAAVKAAAEEIPSTVPWYMVESVLPGAGGDEALVAAAPRKSGKPSKPWLPWAKRQALAGLLLSAARAFHEVRLSHLAHIGANVNQLTRHMNTTGVLGDELGETLAELQETLAELRELMSDLDKRSGAIEELARQVARR